MNAATRNQAAALLARLLSAGRPHRPGTLGRARVILAAAQRRPSGRLPARIAGLLPEPALECYECDHFGLDCRDAAEAAPACSDFTPAEMEGHK